MGLFPLFVELHGRRCVVIGGGAVAERKVDALLAAGAEVTVVASSLTSGLGRRADDGRVTHVARGYERGDLADAALAFAATDDGGINAAVAAEGAARGVWVNAADDPAHCDFILPAVVRRGSLTVAVGTGGASPALARVVRQHIERTLPPRYAVLADIAGETRRDFRTRGRRAGGTAWLAGLDAALAALAAGRSRADARRRLRERLEASPCV
jgi:siroheme synthase-like protein